MPRVSAVYHTAKPYIILGYFVGVKTTILDYIKMVSKIQFLRHFHIWAILSVKHKKSRS